MEDIANVDYAHAARVCKDFQTKVLIEYLDLYIQNDILFLIDVWNSFQKMSLHKIGLDSVHFLLATKLV